MEYKMTLEEIENLTFEELKSRRAELVAEAAKAPAKDVAERFVDARTDAKLRDQTQAKQGVTITALEQGAAAMTEKIAGLTTELNRATEDVAYRKKQLEDCIVDAKAVEQSTAENHAKAVENLNGQIAKLTENLNQQTARAERLKVQAEIHHQAVNAAAKYLNDAIAARGIENADKPE